MKIMTAVQCMRPKNMRPLHTFITQELAMQEAKDCLELKARAEGDDPRNAALAAFAAQRAAAVNQHARCGRCETCMQANVCRHMLTCTMIQQMPLVLDAEPLFHSGKQHLMAYNKRPNSIRPTIDCHSPKGFGCCG